MLVRQNAFPRVLSNLLMKTFHWTAPRPLSSSIVETPFSLFFIKNVSHAGDRNTSYLTNTFSLKCWKCHSSKLLISYFNFCDTTATWLRCVYKTLLVIGIKVKKKTKSSYWATVSLRNSLSNKFNICVSAPRNSMACNIKKQELRLLCDSCNKFRK